MIIKLILIIYLLSSTMVAMDIEMGSSMDSVPSNISDEEEDSIGDMAMHYYFNSSKDIVPPPLEHTIRKKLKESDNYDHKIVLKDLCNDKKACVRIVRDQELCTYVNGILAAAIKEHCDQKQLEIEIFNNIIRDGEREKRNGIIIGIVSLVVTSGVTFLATYLSK